MPCSIVSSSASSTRLSAYFTVHFTCPIWKNPHPPGASLVRHPYKLNRMGDQQCLLSNFSSDLCTYCLPLVHLYLNTWSTYSLLVDFVSPQLPWGCALIWSPFRQYHCLLPVCEASTQFFICVQSLLWYYSQHPFCIPSFFSCSKSTLILSYVHPQFSNHLFYSIFTYLLHGAESFLRS